MSTTTMHSSSVPSPASEAMRDIFFWRKKKLSLLVLLVSTATWVLLQFYQFSFVTVLSWMAMLIVLLLFLWGNLVRLFGKEPPDLSGEEITVESALAVALALRTCTEESIRWMFRVGAESDLLTFALNLGGLWLLSQVGNYFDFLTLHYIAIVMGMTLPVIYAKYEDNIKRLREGVKKQLKRYYDMFDEKVIKKVKNMMGITTTTTTTSITTTTTTPEKEKKVE